ncbi:hypothetical protein TWF481_004420 [Arthrobotrys musiformis]|uniref:RDRP core domain-containing protein n=1 Tax=Arthrobotrys musiformis TaxID=47236 RepID=A0AAV9WJG8_9PEZI
MLFGCPEQFGPYLQDMSSVSDFNLSQDSTFQEVFHALKAKFGFPLPPEELDLASLGHEAYNFFAQSKFLLTYSRRNFIAAVKEFEAFANLDNLAEETLSKASGVQSTERRQAAIQQRRMRAFNQELEKQLKIFKRDGGSIVTQGNQRNSVVGPAGRLATTQRANSLIKTSDNTRQKVLEWQQNNMAARSSGSSNPQSRSGLRTRESFDNEMNDAFPYSFEEPTEIDNEVDESGMIPVHSFRAEVLPGALPEVGSQVPTSRGNPQPRQHPRAAPPPSNPLSASVHSPPSKPVNPQNYNWGAYVPPPETLQRPNSSQVPKPSAVPALNSTLPTTAAAKPAIFAPSAPSDTSTRHPRLEDIRKRERDDRSCDIVERPSKRQSPISQDRPKAMNVPPPRATPGASFSRNTIRQPSLAENQVPSRLKTSVNRRSFETDTTEDSMIDSMFRSRNEYQGTQPTSFNSTMEGKVVTPGRYEDPPEEFIPPPQRPRGESHIGAFHSSRTMSSSSTSSMNGSRPVMRSNRAASPSTQLHSEMEQASSRGSYSVGGSTLEGLCTLDLPKSQRQPPLSNNRPTSRTNPAQIRSNSVVVNTGIHQPDHESAYNSAVSEPPSEVRLPLTESGKPCKFCFFQTLAGESFPGDCYNELFQDLNVPFWLQWEVERIILGTTARDTESSAVPTLLRDLLAAFIAEPDMGYEDARNKLIEFRAQFNLEEKHSIPDLKRELYASILHSENGWSNKIQLSADLHMEKITDPNRASSEVLKPTLRPRSLNLRPTSTRFDRKFGSDRFMTLRIPKIGSISKSKLDPETHYSALARYLSHEGFEFLGRRWRAICHRASTKDENGKRISLAKQDKNLQVIVIMFAESGPGLKPVDQRAAVEWLVPIGSNIDSKQCKLYARIALGFSTTTPTVIFEEDEIDYKIKDIHTRGLEPDRDGNLPEYCLTDGCGLVSPAVLRAVARQLGLPYPPSAVQARIGAAKGLWIVDPSIPLDSEEMQIRIRPDQNKFKDISREPEHRTLDICNTSKPLKVSALNLQFIIILLHNGVTESTLEELLREDIRNEVTELFKDGKLDDGASLRKYLERVRLNGSRRDGKVTAMKGRMPSDLAERAVDLINAGFNLQNLTLKKWFEKVLVRHCESIQEKMRIRIAQSCQPYCVPDPSGKLRKGQVYLRFGPESRFVDPKTMMAMDILRGDVLVGRNPAHFASDVQKVTAVDIPELRYLTDVIVFPADSESNDRSLADYLSGGDYDGDRVWTCWDQRMVREFKGELIHGPSTVNIEAYFSIDRKEMWEDFEEDESHDAFSTFIERHLKTAMKDDLLGQCTTLFEKFVYKNYNDKRGVLNLKEAKELGVACGKLVDAPKQGIQFKPQYWERFKSNYGNGTSMPYYKKSEKELSKELRKAKESRHPIDKLKFRVARHEISSLLTSFEHSCADASHRDDDLLVYANQQFGRCDKDMGSGDPFEKEMAKALLKQKNHLNSRLEFLRQKWGRYWEGRDFESEDQRELETTRTFVEDCVRLFDDIEPCEDDSPVGKALIAQWKLRQRDQFSDWSRLKACLLYERTSRRQDSSPALPWFVAGDILCFEKWRVVSEKSGRRSGVVIPPISSVSRIKASALKRVAEEGDWLSGESGEEGGNQDYSDDDLAD